MAVDAATASEAKETVKPHKTGDEGLSIYIDPVTGQKIPMRDGKPCRTCVDMKTWKRLGKAAAAKTPEKTASTTKESEPKETSNIKAEAVAPSTNEDKVSSPSDSAEWRRKNCPPDVEVLGSSTWTLLHTMAAYYPERPAPSQMDSMKMFFEGFAQHYPCWFCKVSRTLRFLMIIMMVAYFCFSIARTISKSQ
jgi:mitochondrial FAD-linked sulfhydryl oxidase